MSPRLARRRLNRAKRSAAARDIARARILRFTFAPRLDPAEFSAMLAQAVEQALAQSQCDPTAH